MTEVGAAWDDFQLSIDWGNIATVTVAIVAIIVSSRFNVLTLRRSESQFDQHRRDLVTDKLRVEVAEFANAIFQRWALSIMMEPMTQAGSDEDSLAAAKTRFLKALPDPLALHQDFNRMGMRGVSILMLTNDATIRRLVLSVNGEIEAELNDFRSLSQVFRDTTDSGARLAENARNLRAERLRREKSIYDQTDELMLYCVEHFAHGQ